MPCFYLTPEQDEFNKIPELQVCIAEAPYDVDSIVADPDEYLLICFPAGGFVANARNGHDLIFDHLDQGRRLNRTTCIRSAVGHNPDFSFCR